MPTPTSSSKPEVSDELWIRRWLAKTSFVFGLALGIVIGFILAFKTVG